MEPPVLLLLMYGQVFPATPAEKRIVHFRHVLEEPLDVGPLAAKFTLFADFARLDSASIV